MKESLINNLWLKILADELSQEYINTWLCNKTVVLKEKWKVVSKEKNGIWILTKQSFIFITENITTKKNNRSILKNKKTDKFFIGKSQRLINDEWYLELLINNTLFKNSLTSTLMLKEDFIKSLVLLEKIIPNFKIEKILKYYNSTYQDILWYTKEIWEKIDTQLLFYLVWKGKIKDNDNALTLMNDCLEKELKIFNIDFNDKYINHNLATRIHLPKWNNSLNIFIYK